MFLIFGIKRMARRLATVFALCGQCGTPAAQVIARRSTWFSLFFIPLIPLRTIYVSTCTLCGATIKIDKEQAMHMVTAADLSSAPSPPPPAAGHHIPTQALPPSAPPPPT